MIINLILVCLPTMSFYWYITANLSTLLTDSFLLRIPYAGPWTIETLSFVQIIFSVLIYKLSARAIPKYGPGLPKSHLMISLFMWLLITISCIMQTVHWNDQQQYCYSSRYFYF
jgi:hypothetical protein